MRLSAKVLAFVSIVNLIAPAAGLATGSTDGAAAAVNPVSPRPHHKHKKKVSASAASNGTVAPAPDTGSNRKTAAGNTDAPGMSDSLGSNNPGSPNMGSPDHTPGTTGTSGQ